MALRVSKAVFVFAIALFYTILVLNNLTDYGSNCEFVHHVLMMDSTLPGNHLMWRAVNSPLVHTVFYIGIIAWESVTMLLCWWAGVRLLKSPFHICDCHIRNHSPPTSTNATSYSGEV